MQRLIDLGKRLGGFSIDYRRDGTNWPANFKVTIYCNKNERHSWRLFAYGHDIESAIDNLIVKVQEANDQYAEMAKRISAVLHTKNRLYGEN